MMTNQPREIFSADQLNRDFKSVQAGRVAKQSDFDNLTEVGQWFFIPFSKMTKGQIRNESRPQAPNRLICEGRRFKTMKGYFSINGQPEEVGIAVIRIEDVKQDP